METFSKFLYEFLKQFFSGITTVIKAIGTGLGQMFDFSSYQNIIDTYKGDLSAPEWVLVVVSILCILILRAVKYWMFCSLSSCISRDLL